MRTLDELLDQGVGGRRVLVRADLNVPLDAGRITDDGRVRAVLPTLTALRDAGAAVLVCSHLGRPKGAAGRGGATAGGGPPWAVDPRFSLAPVATRLGELLGTSVALADDTAAGSVATDLAGGQVALLENLRFHPGETSKDPAVRAAFADQLAALADAYVDDAFGAVHRAHASVVEVAQRLPGYAGWLVLREVAVLRRLTEAPAAPYLVVLGGAKVSDKLAVIEALLPKVDKLLIGGGMCFTFLRAQGYEVGESLLEQEQVETCRRLLATAGDRIVLPVDVVVAEKVAADAVPATVPAAAIPAGRIGLDIGPTTRSRFAEELAGAETVFWNGPMGVFELAPFAAGTAAVAETIAGLAGFTVVGGGDSAAAVRALGIDESRFDHISTGGGASLEYLEGRTLPGLAALEKS